MSTQIMSTPRGGYIVQVGENYLSLIPEGYSTYGASGLALNSDKEKAHVFAEAVYAEEALKRHQKLDVNAQEEQQQTPQIQDEEVEEQPLKEEE